MLVALNHSILPSLCASKGWLELCGLFHNSTDGKDETRCAPTSIIHCDTPGERQSGCLLPHTRRRSSSTTVVRKPMEAPVDPCLDEYTHPAVVGSTCRWIYKTLFLASQVAKSGIACVETKGPQEM
jgi:hypothetical protein